MKRLPSGLIIFDPIDVICLSFSTGSTLAYFYKKYKVYKKRRNKKRRSGNDPLVTELKEKSPLIMFSEDGKPLKVPLVRGGADRPNRLILQVFSAVLKHRKNKKILRIISVVIKNQKIADIVRAIINEKRSQRQLILLQHFVTLLTSLGLCFHVTGSLDYTQVFLLILPSTVAGFLIGLIASYPLASALLPLLIVYGRGIKDIPDSSAKCKAICKVAEEFHNKQLAIEMKKLNSLVEDAAAALQLPLDKVHLVCVEEKLSLLQRYKLRELIKSEKARKRVQYFSEFIKKFPECDADPEVVYEEIVGKIAE